MSGVGISLLVMALGLILGFAVPVAGHELDLNKLGVLLLVIGVVGLVLTPRAAGPSGAARHHRGRRHGPRPGSRPAASGAAKVLPWEDLFR